MCDVVSKKFLYPTYQFFLSSLKNQGPDLHTNLGKVLNIGMTLPTQTLDPGVLQTPKPIQISKEKTLLY